MYFEEIRLGMQADTAPALIEREKMEFCKEPPMEYPWTVV